ncbi:hypothetical protein ASE70_15040 [Sphingomonas sp. Leaf22]|uniref:head-tail joining protein n=1 Tax=Sphingomonas sp. Leaf22 TaxID=1735687 RepID=UPI0006F781E4|nr:hypothetical protein [Sphingomonas sp. Leaf22]KQM92227.1 hypothetical protein ASE70_15040 [Sphingomonas sp. Leaf22]
MALDAQYHAPGSMAAAFRPAGGDFLPDPIRVIRSMADEDIGFGDTAAVARSGQILVRVSEIAIPITGDLFGIETGEQLRVVGTPRIDLEGLEWTCAVELIG